MTGRAMWNSIATLEALIIASLALPGWTEKPWMVTVADAALKFSYSNSPSMPPSTV